MDNVSIVATVSIITAGICMAVGSIAPAMGQGRAIHGALSSIAQQPDERNSLTRTLFVGLAMMESIAIYCFVISMILVFANPFWAYVIKKAGG
ncbi:MAG: F0F1 ATP synthase subunit C [Deltaproteobacteria bacterium]|jgi:F-type H+-transporting ATPase subunit c|nr:F0F1 ATP synthase subunit C [Deltaproteobacteria bacterium]